MTFDTLSATPKELVDHLLQNRFKVSISTVNVQ
jgi:hypothetical protein